MKKGKKRLKTPTPSPTPVTKRRVPWKLIGILSLLALAVIAVGSNFYRDRPAKQADSAVPIVRDRGDNPVPLAPEPKDPVDETGKEQIETPEELKTRLFPTTGYELFPTIKDVPWEDVLNGGTWTPAEEKLVATAATMVVAVVGKEDPLGKELLNIGKREQVLKGIYPMRRRVAVGLDLKSRTYIDCMWEPGQGKIYVPSGNIQMTRLISELYHEGYHIRQIPTLDAAKKIDLRTMEIEAYRAQRKFNDRLLAALLATNPKDPLQKLRWEREIELINLNVESRIEAYSRGNVPSQLIK